MNVGMGVGYVGKDGKIYTMTGDEAAKLAEKLMGEVQKGNVKPIEDLNIKEAGDVKERIENFVERTERYYAMDAKCLDCMLAFDTKEEVEAFLKKSHSEDEIKIVKGKVVDHKITLKRVEEVVERVEKVATLDD